ANGRPAYSRITSNPPSPRVSPSSVAGTRASSARPIAPSTLASMRRRLVHGVQQTPFPPITRLIVASHHRPLRLVLVTHAECGERLRALLPGETVDVFARLDAALRHLAHSDV